MLEAQVVHVTDDLEPFTTFDPTGVLALCLGLLLFGVGLWLERKYRAK